ncbi:MAG TPA: Ig-like domain-containing protein [Solirubrobacteraceae bacterium]|nr:Ig-like domain-containing protein [Solirubrobacteraceae bacterium]
MARRAILMIASFVVLGVPLALSTPQAALAATACTRVGNLQVTDTDTNTVVGFVSKTWNSFGEFVVTTTPTDYLSVQVTDGATTSITALNGQNASFPLVGGIVGFSNSSNDLGSGSFNYAYLGGTTATAPGAAPQSGANAFTDATGIPEDIESSIWTDGPGAQMIPQWVNTDGSRPATHLVDITGILVMAGDTTAFRNTFGPADDVAINFVPTAAPSGPCATTTTLAAPTPAPAGTPVTFTATVTTSPLAAGPPTGTVGFAADGFSIAGCHGQPLTGTGPYTATCTTSALSVAGSPHSIVATFFADANDQGSTSAPISQVITQAMTATTLTASPASTSTFGQSVTFTASVTPGDGGGTVAFTDGGTTITGCGAKPLTGTGPYTATCTTSALSVAGSPHSIKAIYSGDTDYAGSTSSPRAYTVNKAATTTTLTVSPASPSVFGQPVTFKATVAPVAPGAGTPTGTVTFTDGGTAIPGCSAQPLSASSPDTATCTTSGLSVAGSPHSIKATYGGDGNFAGSTSSGLAYTVNKAATTTTVTASPASSSTFGQSVTLTATVAPVAPGAGTPTGTVTFTVDGTTVGTAPVSATGHASIATTSLSAGSHTIVATYSGDGNFLGSSGNVSYSVTCATTITGNHSGALEVTSSTCVAPGGSVSGPIIVHGGGSLDLEGATVNGSVSATGGSGVIRICGSAISGTVDIKSQTALVIVGDPGDAACAPNRIGGSLILQNNTGGVEAINNTVTGAVSASGNSGPGPFPGDPTTIAGNHS